MPRPIDHIEALRHLDPEGALAGLDLTDAEGMAIRAACDLVGMQRDPPVQGERGDSRRADRLPDRRRIVAADKPEA